MISDIHRLDVLVVGQDADRQRLLKAVLKFAGLTKIHTASDHAQALESLSTIRIDALFIEHCDDDVGSANLISMARKPGMPNPTIPIFAIMITPTRAHVEHARDLGVTDALTMPINVATIKKKLVCCIQTPRPFVTESGFIGPDRRTHRAIPVIGKSDRRKRIPTLISVPTINKQ